MTHTYPAWQDRFVHQDVHGRWYFEDETGADDSRRFDTEEEAHAALKTYADSL